MSDPRTAEISQDIAKTSLHDRPTAESWVRNPTLSAQLIGDFAKFLQIERNVAESRPFNAEPAEWRIREPPEILQGHWRYFYTIGRRIMGCGIPHFQPM